MAEPLHHQLIKHFEACKLRPYLCSAGVPTIGWGSTRYADGRKVTLQDPPITQAQADALFLVTIRDYEAGVNRLVTNLSLLPQHRGALVSFAYNLGLDEDADDIAEGLGDSTLLKLVNKGDLLAASRQFPKWNRVNRVPSWGVHRRRLAEAHLFLTGELKLDWNRKDYGF